MYPKRHLAARLAAIATLGLSVGLGFAPPSGAEMPGVTPTLPPAPIAGPNPAAPAHVFNVVAYGADPTGRSDSTVAIRNAIAAARAAGGNQTLYFPSGTYLLSNPSGQVVGITKRSGAPLEAELYLNGSNGSIINVLGAGQATTKVVEAVGITNPAYSHLARGFNAFEFQDMSGFYFSGLTVDSRTYTAGDTLDDQGSNTLIENSNFEGAMESTPTHNPDTFALRVLKICGVVPASNGGAPAGYTGPNFASGNVVTNDTVSGGGSGGNDDLDFSCQRGGAVSNITDTGWGTAIYEDYGVTVDNYRFTPGSNPSNPGFYITDSSRVSIDNFVSSGHGGIVAGGGPGQTTFDTTIRGENAPGTVGQLVIAGSVNTTIAGSTLGGLAIAPTQMGAELFASVSGVTVTGSTVGVVHCGSGSVTIGGFSGVACPVRMVS